MGDYCTGGGGFGAPPSHISLSPFPPSASPSPRRLSRNFKPPSRPLQVQRQLAWVSLQGRLIGAEEASSSRAIGGGFSREEAVAWDLFSPVHRFLLVAVIAVAASESEKNKQIFRLQKSVQFRDEVLSSMQEKLDNLCEQTKIFSEIKHPFDQSMSCTCRPCHQHELPSCDLNNTMDMEAYDVDGTSNCKLKLSNEEQQPEERRMSDLSDWAPSVTSSSDFQLNSLAIEQDMHNLKRECEEKSATIKELSNLLHSSEIHGSKRVVELEEIVRRKNMIITRLRKDMMVLEQKVMQLTRTRRNSFSKSSSSSSSSSSKLPLMADNIIYDMDSTTGPSSDSDASTSTRNRPPLPQPCTIQKKEVSKSNNVEVKKRLPAVNSSSVKLSDRTKYSRHITPLKEKSMNEIQTVSNGRDRRRVSHKRWT